MTLPFYLCHLLGMEHLVEFLGGEEAQLYAGVLERNIFLKSQLNRFGGVFVAYVRIECSNQHK